MTPNKQYHHLPPKKPCEVCDLPKSIHKEEQSLQGWEEDIISLIEMDDNDAVIGIVSSLLSKQAAKSKEEERKRCAKIVMNLKEPSFAESLDDHDQAYMSGWDTAKIDIQKAILSDDLPDNKKV